MTAGLSDTPPGRPIGLAFVGCGFMADYYRTCLPIHAGRLFVAGAFDRDAGRMASYRACWGDRTYGSLDEALADPAVEIVVNLTDPHSHAAVSHAAIAAGRHVYSEKPLGMTYAQARGVRDAARRQGVLLSGAPCVLLGEAAQTLWKAVREERAGRVRLVYAEIDDGMIHRLDRSSWTSPSGKPWPAAGEFEVGCTYEHAGYVVAILAGLFGPVRRITAFSALLVPDKGVGAGGLAPDFSVGCLEFDGGIVARLTNSVVAPYDHRLRIVGDEGVLELGEVWDFAAPVRLRRRAGSRLARWSERRLGYAPRTRLRPVRASHNGWRRRYPDMDWLCGVRDMAEALREGRRPRLDDDFAVHITEVTELLQHPERRPRPSAVESSFAAPTPMPWAMETGR
ncbi:MAG: Gfo/Idh/MocA family oxidoreductase [Methylobacterium frigidaeris]